MSSFTYNLVSFLLIKYNFVPRNPLAQMEEEKREHDLKMKKMESEMEQVGVVHFILII